MVSNISWCMMTTAASSRLMFHSQAQFIPSYDCLCRGNMLRWGENVRLLKQDLLNQLVWRVVYSDYKGELYNYDYSFCSWPSLGSDQEAEHCQICRRKVRHSALSSIWYRQQFSLFFDSFVILVLSPQFLFRAFIMARACCFNDDECATERSAPSCARVIQPVSQLVLITVGWKSWNIPQQWAKDVSPVKRVGGWILSPPP